MQAQDLSRIIEMAWEDRTPFEAIEHLYGLNQSAVVVLMRQQLKSSSFKMWRKRVAGRKTKHFRLTRLSLICSHSNRFERFDVHKMR